MKDDKTYELYKETIEDFGEEYPMSQWDENFVLGLQNTLRQYKKDRLYYEKKIELVEHQFEKNYHLVMEIYKAALIGKESDSDGVEVEK